METRKKGFAATLRQKLVGLGLLSACLTLSVGGYSYYALRQTLDATENMQATTAIQQLQSQVKIMTANVRADAYTSFSATFKPATQVGSNEVAESIKAFNRSFEELERSVTDPEIKGRLRQARQLSQAYIQHAQTMPSSISSVATDMAKVAAAQAALVESNQESGSAKSNKAKKERKQKDDQQRAELEALNTKIATAKTQVLANLTLFESQARAFEEKMDELGRMMADAIKKAQAESQQTEQFVIQIAILIVAAAVLLSLFVSLFIARSVARPVKQVADAAATLAEDHLPQLTAAAKAIAAGNLRHQVELKVETINVASNDELGRLAQAFNATFENMNEMAGCFDQMTIKLRKSVNEIGIDATRIAHASELIDKTSCEAQSSTEVLASLSQQISTTVHKMAASISRVSSNAQTQSASATETSAAVTEMVSNLQSIAAVTEQLGKLTQNAYETAQKGQQTLVQASESLNRVSSSV
ncbi:MAG TPA: methyl-accepting chemotaxis protein, partial [Blastocatellia bacterium]|nr:methyl-accepting chemotaxis protein [Blastocatellia bacterium]